MEHEVALHFRDQLKSARALAFRDSEAFHEVVIVIERIGLYLLGGMGSLNSYRDVIKTIAANSPMAVEVPYALPELHPLFEAQYEIVREARNAALHEGAFARHLTTNAVELSLVLEEALMQGHHRVGDFMVRNPACAYLWQPLSFIRQSMLVNSFSYLPVPIEKDSKITWQLIADFGLAQYLRKDGRASKERLTETLRHAVDSGQINLLPAETCSPEDKIELVLPRLGAFPAIVLSSERGDAIGILTPFDLL